MWAKQQKKVFRYTSQRLHELSLFCLSEVDKYYPRCSLFHASFELIKLNEYHMLKAQFLTGVT